MARKIVQSLPEEQREAIALSREKHLLRNQVLALRDGLSPVERQKGSQALKCHQHIFGPVRNKVVSTFWPIKSEIDPGPLCEALQLGGALLALPVILNKTEIEFRRYETSEDLIDAGFGTKGPPSSAPVIEPDCLLVPLSVFDASGARIGYGAGFYDRAIARLYKLGKNPKTFGLAFSIQQVAKVPQNAHDWRLDAVLTPDGAFLPTKERVP